MWQLREWWLPKQGNPPEEYEDAFRTALHRGRFAVADGATETSFSRQWAQALVDTFVEAPPLPEADAEALGAWLKPLQEKWHASVPWDRLPWYGLEKARAGAFASLLGLEMLPREAGGACWRASAVGDSVLFQIRGDTLLRAWPVSTAAKLGSRPLLLGSVAARNRAALAAWARVSGEAEPGDRFFMVTDALAHWLLTAVEAGEAPWEPVWAIADEDAFAAFATGEREARRLRNDDLTLIAFRVPDAWEIEPETQPAPVTALVPVGEVRRQEEDLPRA